jgi:hypothetical protein
MSTSDKNNATKPKKKPKLKLTGKNGNAWVLLGEAARVAKLNNIDFKPIQDEAMSGDYDHLLQTLMRYFDVS